MATRTPREVRFALETYRWRDNRQLGYMRTNGTSCGATLRSPQVGGRKRVLDKHGELFHSVQTSRRVSIIIVVSDIYRRGRASELKRKEHTGSCVPLRSHASIIVSSHRCRRQACCAAQIECPNHQRASPEEASNK